MPQLQAVVFDWGGTLTPFHLVDPVVQWRVPAALLGAMNPDHAEVLAQALVAAEADFWQLVQAGGATSTTTTALLAQVVRAHGLTEPAAGFEPLVAALMTAWAPHNIHRPEAAAVLNSLRRSGLRLGLLSNTHWPRADHDGWLARDGLLGLLDATTYTSELAVSKPHPEAFRAALAALGVDDPRRAVFVGDRPIDDISGAAALGMRTVRIVNEHVPAGPVEPDAALPDLTGLPRVVAGFAAG